MTCILINHNYINEVQTMSQLFFPGENFNAIYEYPTEYPQGYVIETFVSDNDGVPNVSARVKKDGQTLAQTTLYNSPFPLELSWRRVLMLAMYQVLQEAVPTYTPWGALTGIRPTKMVREWLSSGYSHEKIIAIMAGPFHCMEEKARLALEVAKAEIELTRRIYAPARHCEEHSDEAIQKARHCNSLCHSGLDPESSCNGLQAMLTTIKTNKTYPTTFCLKIEPQEEFPSVVPQLPAPVGIYISIPFCPTRCIYCSFNVDHKPVAKDIEAQYIAKLIKEFPATVQRLRELGGVVSSIYIGGGTPTVLSEKLLEQLLDAVATSFHPQPGLEFSVEAGRPDTFTQSKLTLLRRYGVNRIAVNPQTLNDNTLSIIGRKHTAADFFHAFNMARDAGFECINTDIIAGLPGETPDDMHRTMEGIAELSPENITVHTLAVKRASRLNAALESYVLPDAKTTETMLSIANATCQSAGLAPYYLYRQKNMVGMFENVGYSKPGHECLYNVGMMAETQTVLGIGAGAVSKFVDLANNKISREFNVKNPEIYVERNIK